MANAGQANAENGPTGPRAAHAGLLPRVLFGGQVTLVGDNVISVVEG